MLWNPEHDRKTEIDVYDLDLIIAFLKTKNADTRYRYDDCGGKCLYSQYMIWLGYPADHFIADSKFFSVWARLNKMYGTIGATKPWTFSAALKRAENWRQFQWTLSQPIRRIRS